MVLRVGAAISEILNNAIGNKLKGGVIPILSQEDVPMPFIAYRRSGLEPKYTKDPYAFEDDVIMDVVVITARYGEGITLASEVLEALERKRGAFAGVKIEDIRLEDTFEDADEVFVQGLIFKITINREK